MKEEKDKEPGDEVFILIFPPLLSKISGKPSPLISETINSREPSFVCNSIPFVKESDELFEVFLYITDLQVELSNV